MAEEPAPSPQDDPESAKPEQKPLARADVIVADIALLMGTAFLRKGVERVLLKGQTGKDASKELKSKRGKVQSAATGLAAKIGSSSVPGAAVVGAGFLVKLLVDRSLARSEARRQERRAALTDQSAD